MARRDDSRYHALREQIEGLLTEGRQSRAQAAEAEKLQTYWHALFSHFRGQPDPDYGQQTVSNLSKDPKLAVSSLYDILRFRRLLSNFPTCGNLSWSHFRILVHLPCGEARLLPSSGRRRPLDRAQLKQAIDADHGGQLLPGADATPRPLRARFGSCPPTA
jgi:hypothetical protein